MEPGVQTPEQTLKNASGSCRDSAWLLVQLLRHLGLAARFVSGLPDPAEARRQVARRPERHRGRLHRPARLVRGLSAGRRLDRPRSDLGPASPAKATSRSRARPSRSSAAPISGVLDPCETTFEHHMSVRARLGGAARHHAVQRAAVGRDRRARQAGRRRPAPHGRPPDAGRRADLRLGRRPRGRRVEHRGDGPDQARPERRADGQRLRKKYGHGGLRPLRPGQVVSGRAAAALVAQPASGAPTASRSGTTRTCIASEHDDHGATPEQAREFLRRLALRLGVDPAQRLSRLRGRVVLTSGAKASCRATSIRSSRTSPTRPSAIACAASSSAASSSRSATRLPIARDERDDRRWRSTPWYLRDDRCYLIPGDSPLGFRLPLASLPWARAGDLPWIYPPDASDELPPLALDDGQRTGDGPAWHSSDEAGRPRSVAHETPSGTHDIADAAADAAMPADARAAGNRPASSSAPRSAPRRATAGSTSSCRRPRRSRTTSSSSPRSRRPRRRCACRWCSRATSRPRIRAWCCCASRPTPA